MPKQVVNGAKLQCSFGTKSSDFVVLETNEVQAEKQYSANIKDHISMTNIMPFGMCKSLANPQVAAATSAALGVLTPQPCVPNTTSPWTPGSPTVMIKNQPALDTPSICMCKWLGVITITKEGQLHEDIP